MPEFKYNYLLFFEYDGTNFVGWQKQPEGRTVYSQIEKAAKVVLGDIKLTGSSRTDSGVHAESSAANILANKKIILSKLKLSLNSLLPKDIAIKQIKYVGIGFNARFDAKEKIYEYRIWNKTNRNVWTKKYAWHIAKPLDTAAIRKATKVLLGKHDYSAFCGSKASPGSRWVNLKDISVKRKNSHLVLGFRADRFLNHMVRNMVGTLVYAGLGKLSTQEIGEILKNRKYAILGQAAPGHGLFLKKVIY
jgi:tRNA pseudouridine38-40 synthase